MSIINVVAASSSLIVILFCFVFGWFSAKREHCKVIKNEPHAKNDVFVVLGATALLLLAAMVVFGDLIFFFIWTPLVSFKLEGCTHPIMFFIWIFAYVLIFWTMYAITHAGMRLGEYVREKLANKERHNCYENLDYNINCPFACEDCPLARFIKTEEVLFKAPKGIIPDVCDDAPKYYAYYKVSNSHVGKSSFAIKQQAKDGHLFFVPMPTVFKSDHQYFDAKDVAQPKNQTETN